MVELADLMLKVLTVVVITILTDVAVMDSQLLMMTNPTVLVLTLNLVVVKMVKLKRKTSKVVIVDVNIPNLDVAMMKQLLKKMLKEPTVVVMTLMSILVLLQNLDVVQMELLLRKITVIIVELMDVLIPNSVAVLMVSPPKNLLLINVVKFPNLVVVQMMEKLP